MSNIPSDLKYTRSHEWVRKEADGTYTVGITDNAQQLLGDMVFIQLPKVGTTIVAGHECTVAESVKAASEVFAPISGEIIAVNEELEAEPDLVNADAYGEGWFFRVKPSNESDFDQLLNAEQYQASFDDEA